MKTNRIFSILSIIGLGLLALSQPTSAAGHGGGGGGGGGHGGGHFGGGGFHGGGFGGGGHFGGGGGLAMQGAPSWVPQLSSPAPPIQSRQTGLHRFPRKFGTLPDAS